MISYNILDKEGQKGQLIRRLRELEKDHYRLTIYGNVLEQQLPNEEEGPEQMRLSAELARNKVKLRQCEIEISVITSHLKDVQ